MFGYTFPPLYSLCCLGFAWTVESWRSGHARRAGRSIPAEHLVWRRAAGANATNAEGWTGNSYASEAADSLAVGRLPRLIAAAQAVSRRPRRLADSGSHLGLG